VGQKNNFSISEGSMELCRKQKQNVESFFRACVGIFFAFRAHTDRV